MPTISKFYLLDAATPNTGTMPTGAHINTNIGAGTPAAGARTARDATDVKGTANPDTESSITAAATVAAQQYEHRRFVSRPLAAQTFATADGNWTFSFARSESNTNHNGQIVASVYLWRPSSGLRVGTIVIVLAGAIMAATAETAETASPSGWTGSQAIQGGDILVFEIDTSFTQAMSTAYTDQFAYNGTTEASTTTCASFIAPPAPLNLAKRQPRHPGINHQNPALLMEKLGAKWEQTRDRIWLPNFAAA